MSQNFKNLSKFSIQFRRSVSTSVPKCKDKIVCEAPAAAAPPSLDAIGGHTVVVSNFQKRILVWAKQYASFVEVPERVPMAKLNKARDICRIKAATYSMGLTLLGALVMIISGKNAAQRGESVEQKVLDWHMDYIDKQSTEKAQ